MSKLFSTQGYALLEPSVEAVHPTSSVHHSNIRVDVDSLSVLQASWSGWISQPT